MKRNDTELLLNSLLIAGGTLALVCLLALAFMQRIGWLH